MKLSEKEYIYFNESESVSKSIYKDFVTFTLMAFCIYISQDSTFWTFISGLLFIAFTFIRVSFVLDKRRIFSSKKDLIEFVNNLPDDESVNE